MISTAKGNKDYVATFYIQVKNGSKWVNTEVYSEDFTRKQYEGITDNTWVAHFRGMGETMTRYKDYTSEGYNYVKVIKTEKNKKKRMVVYLLPIRDWKARRGL